ncbi:hypothetical protein [Paenibacillus sp. WC2504]|uniref:hypothetical protein n=1 Tax=Paenibacillus sp. WC2504 TaxID=3461403 RepID=UPI004046231D
MNNGKKTYGQIRTSPKKTICDRVNLASYHNVLVDGGLVSLHAIDHYDHATVHRANRDTGSGVGGGADMERDK